MEMENVKAGLLVMITNPIEKELDGVIRRRGIVGMVESPVFGGGGIWWWITHSNGEQGRYRCCEISVIETRDNIDNTN